MSDAGKSTVTRSLVLRVALSALLAFYVCAQLIAGSPPSTLRTSASTAFKQPLISLGLFNSFGFFAPEPRTYNYRLAAKVTFANGSIADWSFPHVTGSSLSDFQKHLISPYVRWQFFILEGGPDHLLWVDAARYIARLHANKANPPRSVSLYRNISEITWPGSTPNPAKQTENKWEKFFDYSVKPGDLK